MLERNRTPEIVKSLYATKKDAWVYDQAYENTETEDIPFWLNIARQLKPRSILEVGVGAGRIAIPLAKAGLNITGLDQEESMLEIAREKTAKLPQKIQDKLKFVQGDARNADLGQVFDLITIPFNTFCHLLTKEDQIEALKNLKKHLNPEKGVLVIDMFNPFARRIQRWDSLKQGPIPTDRPPSKIYINFNEQKKFHITRMIRDYVEIPEGESILSDIKRFMIDRETEVIDWNTNPPVVLKNRAVFTASYRDIFSLWFDGVFRKSGFEKARFVGDYQGHEFVDAKVAEDLQKIEYVDHSSASEKIIVVLGPGQKEVKIKDYSLEIAEKVKDSVLEFAWNNNKIKIFDRQNAANFLDFISRFSKLSKTDMKIVLKEMGKILKEVKTSKS